MQLGVSKLSSPLTCIIGGLREKSYLKVSPFFHMFLASYVFCSRISLFQLTVRPPAWVGSSLVSKVALADQKNSSMITGGEISGPEISIENKSFLQGEITGRCNGM